MALKDTIAGLFDISDTYDTLMRFHRDEPPGGYAAGAHPRQWDPMAVLKHTEDRDDPTRIGIIGAGAAGIHLAWLLKRRGFRDVTILERNNRIGGKVHTVEHDGIRHEMGACYTTPAYQEVREMLAMFGLNQYIPVAGRTVYEEDGTGQEFGDWVAVELKRSLKESGDWRHRLPSAVLILLVLVEINRYNRIFHRLFGKFDGQLPPRPGPETMKALDCSYIEYLYQNKLELLVPLLRLFQSAQGYGYLENVPALYGLMWNNPDTLKIAPEQLTAQPKPGEESPGGNLIRAGMIKLFEAMVSDQDLQIRLHQQVEQIRRDGEVEVDTVHTQTGEKTTHRFDRIIIAANARQALGWLAAPTEAEQELFSDQVVHGMTTSLQLGRQKDRHKIDSWFYNIEPGRDHRVITQRLSEAFYDEAAFASKPAEQPDARVIFQYGESGEGTVEPSTIDRLYDEHYDEFGVEGAQVIDRFYWLDYFPHWKLPGVMAGKPWRVLDLQGQQNTYWVGGSVSFESLNDITCYNLLITHLHFDQG